MTLTILMSLEDELTDALSDVYRSAGEVNTMTNFQELHQTLAKLERKHKGSSDRMNEDEVKEFWEQEILSVAGSPPKKHRKAKKQNLIGSTSGTGDERDDTHRDDEER